MDIQKISKKLSGEKYTDSSPISTRFFGNTGLRLPILGLGGGVGFSDISHQRSKDIWDTAVKSGIRYIDTAYNYGESQKRLGELINGSDDFFISTKSNQRDSTKFHQELEESIDLLRRPPDLLQIHNIKRSERQDLLRRGGIIDKAKEAKKEGLCKFIGITGHDCYSLWEILRWSKGIDSVLCILNVSDIRSLDRLIPYCKEKGIAIIGMKIMGKGLLIRPDSPGVKTGNQALRFALSCGIDIGIVGFSFPEEIDKIMETVIDFEPMPEWEMKELHLRTLSYSQDLWFYREGVEKWDETYDIRPSLNTYKEGI